MRRECRGVGASGYIAKELESVMQFRHCCIITAEVRKKYDTHAKDNSLPVSTTDIMPLIYNSGEHSRIAKYMRPMTSRVYTRAEF